jgi:hypothetical protein
MHFSLRQTRHLDVHHQQLSGQQTLSQYCYLNKGGGNSSSSGRLEIHDFSQERVQPASNSSANRKRDLAEDPCTYLYTIEPTLLDLRGTETSLSCIAMNSSRTHNLGFFTDAYSFTTYIDNGKAVELVILAAL